MARNFGRGGFWPFFFYQEGRVAENTLSGVRFRGLRYSKLSEIC